MAKVYQPADKTHLYIRYQLNGEWKSKATPFVKGEEVKALRYAAELEGQAPPTPRTYTVAAWADEWLDQRSQRGTDDWKNDQSRLAHHVLPHIGHLVLGEVRPPHLIAIVEVMKRKGLAPRTIRNVYTVIQVMWKDARLNELTLTDPCVLTFRQLGKVQDKDLGWRREAVYTRGELMMLLMDERIPFNRRVLWGLLGLGGLRDGEACGLRWKNVDLEPAPLGRITVVASYDRPRPKTGDERWMPIHPALNVLLYVWMTSGWQEQMGRSWTEDDLVCPAPNPTNRGPRKAFGSMLDRHWIWKRLQKDLVLLGFRHRRAHDLRRTVISLSVEDGADEVILKRGTHAPPKHVMGLYTSPAWSRLCEEVAKLKLETREPKVFGPRVRRIRPPPSRTVPKVRTVPSPKAG